MKPGLQARKSGTASLPARSTIHASPVFMVTFGLLFALPVFFTWGQLLEEFEFTKASLLVTGALVLAAWWIASESSRIGSAGLIGWLRALPGRIAAAARRDPLGAAVGLMLLSAAASTIASVRPALSLFGAPQSHAGLKTIAALAAIYYASRSLASDATWIRRMAQAAGAGAAIASGYALVQVLNLDPLTWQRQSAFGGWIRAGSTVGHANTLSAYLTMCVPLVVWLAARARSRAGMIAWLLTAAVSLFIIVASLSRGAWLGTAAAVLAALVLALGSGTRPARRWVLIVGAIVVVAVAVPLVTPMRDALVARLQQLTDFGSDTSRTRIELWRAGLQMFAHHPLLGAGLDAYVAAFPPYRTTTLTRLEWGGTPAKAHNDAVQILATQGSLGALAALAIVIFAVLALWHIARRGSPETRIAAVAVGAALAGYVASSLVGFGTVATSALAAALAGWAARASRIAEGHAPPTPREALAVRSVWHLAAGIALAGALWFVLVGKPLRAEILLAQGMRHPVGSAERDELLARAASTAPWDPRYAAELGRSLFTEALREQDPQARLYLVDRARAALEKAVRAAPENGENRILLATAMSGQAAMRQQTDSKDEVREAFRTAVALDPLSPVVLVSAERGLLAAGLDEDGRELALRSLAAYPDYAPPLADLGAIALEQGRTADAADTLKLALKRDWRGDAGGAANAWNILARASLALGRNEEAEAAADSALALDPRLAQAFAIKEAAKHAISRKGSGGSRGK
jgi:O-antigen ligase/tetratricopeptide (TPR) repeat protein